MIWSPEKESCSFKQSSSYQDTEVSTIDLNSDQQVNSNLTLLKSFTIFYKYKVRYKDFSILRKFIFIFYNNLDHFFDNG